jgi:hypothetical protein
VKSCARCVASVVIALVALSTALATPAHASAYRYWSYWTWTDGHWQYSNKGPSAGVHAGDVIGWRFAVQANSSQAIAPRIGAGSCDASTQVGVVIDYGTTQDEPPGEHPPSPALQRTCVASSNNTGYRATDAAAPIRTNDSGLVCGIDGYPAHECAPVVDAPKPSPSVTSQATRPRPVTQAHRHPAAVSHPSTTGRTAQPGAAAGPTASRAAAAPGATTPSSSESPPLAVATTAPEAAHSGGGSGVPVALIVGVVLAAALGGFAVWRYRLGAS